ncbi:MAG TPA: IS66 family insertion sequence hypothetical protein [Prolixibacteraceae bacterium]|jgi:hypothetical protein|nr:IS66 family insertion sequence hypothetical protein [Prolixibacteraceae bacterium]
MLNEKKFRAIYDEFLSSGLSVRDYCLNQHFNEAKFYYWQNKLKADLPPKSGFVPVVFDNRGEIPSRRTSLTDHPLIAKKGDTPAPAVFCEISYPGGVSVKLSGMPDLHLLQSLILLATR